jgi:hypothetical protein
MHEYNELILISTNNNNYKFLQFKREVLNMVYENAPIQGCKKICQSIDGSCGEKLKNISFCPIEPTKNLADI